MRVVNGTIATIALMPLLCVCAEAQDVPEDLLYAAHFDHYPAASWAAGERAPALRLPQDRIVEGRFGGGLSLEGGATYTIVGNDGNFRPDRGTIEFWVQPSWDGDDGQVHVLLTATVERGNYLNIAKLDDDTLGAATGGAGVGHYVRVDADISGWRAGEWHHVATTWGDGRLAFYLDGERVGEKGESIPPLRAPEQIVLGPSLDGTIDELLIWSEPRARFPLEQPMATPELEPPEAVEIMPPPVTELDRYLFDLPDSAPGYRIAPKHFVDEIDRQARPEFPDEPSLSTFSARDEWRTLGFVVYATRDLSDLSFTPGELSGPDGATIPAASFDVRLSRRVMQRRAPRVPDDDRVEASALLDPARPFDLLAGHFKEVSLTIRVPSNAPAGEYAGKLAIDCVGGESSSIPVLIEVLPFRLEPSERKAFGMYYRLDLSEAARERVLAELQDIRDHHVTRLFTWTGLRFEERDGEIVAIYDDVEDTLALLGEMGFHGEVVLQDGLQQLARLLGHDAEEGSHGETIAADERFAQIAEIAIRGLDPLRERYPQFEIVLTHMDEVMGERRRDLYIELARPIRRVPGQRIYITMHTLPRDYVPGAIAELDPWMDIRGYNGYALGMYIQAGGSWEAIAEDLESSGDEGWYYYNPHRPWYTAKWSRLINGLYFNATPFTVHCPYRYRTMNTWPLSFIHNMAYTVMSPEDFVTPIPLRNWEGFRLGAQDAWYFALLQDLVGEATAAGVDCAEAQAWLAELREMVPDTGQVQQVSREEYANYPVVATMSDRLDGAALEEIRRTTADHIVALREHLGR